MPQNKPIKKTAAKKVVAKRLVLLDSHAILHRAYHALPDFATSTGEATGALYGLCAMVLKIAADLKPDYIVATYDLPGPTFRREAYEGYKSGRPKTDEALVSQIERSRDIFAAFNIPLYEKPGFEADDMLGTIVEELHDGKDVNIVIASGDMDTLQLVKDKRVQVYTLKKGINDTILYDEKAVEERYGFSPKLLPDYKGLRGDPSDNIIGIKGIGEKTATDLIKRFGSIETIYKVLKKNRKEFLDAGFSPRMVELLENNKEEAQFSKMLGTIRRDAPINFKLPAENWKPSVDPKKVDELLTKLEFRTLRERARQYLLSGNEAVAAESAPAEEIDPLELKETGIIVWLLNSNLTDPSLDDILNFTKKDTFAEAREAAFAMLKKEKSLEKVFDEIEKPLLPIVEKMHQAGVKIDREKFAELTKEYRAESNRLEKTIWKLAGEEFNIGSPKQLGVILFEKLQLAGARQKKTAGGQLSTKESELEKLRESHPIIGSILEYRELQKLLGTYLEALPPLADTSDRIHSYWSQAGTTTGRIASNSPNLQNIPIKNELGKRIRTGFIAEKGRKLVALDYSQIELRIAAFLSGDKALIDIFKNGSDVHAAVAARVFKVPEKEVTSEMRRKAKVINFGILYGMGVNALKENLKTDRAEAQAFYTQYFEAFSTLANYLDTIRTTTAERGYTETFFGRRRRFDDIKSHIPFIRAAAERMAVNAPFQGTQADLIKIAMRRIDDHLTKENLQEKVILVLQVHDELIYEIENDLVESVGKEIKSIMENVVPPSEVKGVPIVANARSGKNWGEL